MSSDDKGMEPGSCSALYQTFINPEPWTPLLQVEHANEASSERNQRNLLGGYKEVSGDDKEVTAAANFAAQQLSEQSNSLQPFAVQEVRGGAWVLGFTGA